MKANLTRGNSITENYLPFDDFESGIIIASLLITDLIEQRRRYLAGYAPKHPPGGTQVIGQAAIITKEGVKLEMPENLGIKNDKKSCIGDRLEAGFLYFLNARGTDLYKIGISGDFNRRFRDMIRDPQTKEDFLHKYYQFKEIVSFFKQWSTL